MTAHGDFAVRTPEAAEVSLQVEEEWRRVRAIVLARDGMVLWAAMSPV
jgi:hypothetical protein